MTRPWILFLPILLFCTQAGAVVRIDNMELRSSLYDIDSLIREGDYSAAEAALLRLTNSGVDETQLRLRRAQLAAVTGDHVAAIRFCRAGLEEGMDGRRLRLQLIESLAALDSLPAAEREATVYLSDTHLNPLEGQLIVDIWLQQDQPQKGLAVCDTLRRRFRDPALLARSRAVCLAGLGRYREASAEYLKHLHASPHALAEIRRALPGQLATDEEAAREFTAGLRDSLQSVSGAHAVILSIDVLLCLQDTDQAIHLLEAYDWTPRATVWMLQLIEDMISRLTADDVRSESPRRWLLSALTDIYDQRRISGRQVPALQNMTADLILAVLDGESDHQLPGDLHRDLESLLGRAEAAGPVPERIMKAHIRLAEHDCRWGGVSPRVIDDLQSLSGSAPSYEVRAQALLALGGCQLAGGDTLAARRILTTLEAGALTTDARLRGSFLLGQLDLAQDQWESARERFAALAAADPGADISNDALDVGLLLAEMIDDPFLDPRARTLWNRVTLDLLLGRREDRLTALAELSSLAAGKSSPATLTVCEQALLDLAQARMRQGDTSQAIVDYGRLVLDYPNGRYPAQALMRKGELQAEVGQADDALRSWELLLVQYPTSPQAEYARIRLQEYR